MPFVNKISAQTTNISQNQELAISSTKPIQIAQNNIKTNLQSTRYSLIKREKFNPSQGEMTWIVQDNCQCKGVQCLSECMTPLVIWADLIDDGGIAFKRAMVVIQGQDKRKRLTLNVNPSDLKNAVEINIHH